MVIEIKNFYQYPFAMTPLKDPKTGEAITESLFNERLTVESERFLELTSRIIHRYGGDLLQFLGNSLIAVWPRGYVDRFPGTLENEIMRR
jgi:hypothetical protein